MDDGTPEPKRCEVCGRPLRRDNTMGVCRKTPACIKRRTEISRQRRGGPVPCRRETCAHPDDCPNQNRKGGYCEVHARRLEKTGTLGPVETKRIKVIVLAGQVFGRWTALEDHNSADRRTLCRCECGNERRIVSRTLLSGASQSCGCLHREVAHQPRAAGKSGIYLPSGYAFGRLTTLEDAIYSRDLVRCRCECGNEAALRATWLKNQNTKSCGCLRDETLRTHGLSSHPLYRIWYGMVDRATNPDNPAYPEYGGRGIAVCERWQGLPDGLLNFIADVGERPPGTSLDRFPDNDGPYAPDNVRWASASQQGYNRRRVGKLTRELAARDAMIESLTAEVDRLTNLLAARKHSEPGREQAEMRPLF